MAWFLSTADCSAEEGFARSIINQIAPWPESVVPVGMMEDSLAPCAAPRRHQFEHHAATHGAALIFTVIRRAVQIAPRPE